MQQVKKTLPRFISRAAALALCLGLNWSGGVVQAASADISTTPLANTADITAKPNVMFILDSSGSMAWAFMPDDLGQDFSQPNDNPTDTTALTRYGGRSAQCNGVAYNPNFDYAGNLPLRPDGTTYPHASFRWAPSDGFQASLNNAQTVSNAFAPSLGNKTLTITGNNLSASSFAANAIVTLVNRSDDSQWMVATVQSWSNPTLVVNVTYMVGGDGSSVSWRVGTRSGSDLNNSYYYNYNVTGSSAKKPLSWKYTTSGLDRTNDGGFANECLTDTGTTLSTFTRVNVTTSSTETEKQNYADWYSYYRKRYLMMRTVAGRSFSPITAKFRVGFTTISDTSAAPSSSFLPVESFEGTQKTAFYNDLYKSDPNNSTPLRGALSKVGRYFANKASGQTTDPMQYACQRNYAILSTDGYWNSGNESTTYGPLKLDGTTTVGQQDATEARPMYDGTNIILTTTTPYTVLKHQRSVYTRTTTTVRSRYLYANTNTGCSGSRTRTSRQEQRSTQTKLESVTDFQDVSGTFTRTRVTTNGTLTSDTNSTTTWGAAATTSTTTTLTSDTTGSYNNFGSVTYTTSCANTAATLPNPNPSAVTVLSGPTASNGAATVSTVSTDTAVPGTESAPTQTTSGGSTNSLADVAQYYYATDLRTATLDNCTGASRADGTAGDVCNNEVPPTGLDRNDAQHMTTYTLGLGVNGVLPFNKNYLDPGLRSGSYYEISNNLNGTMWPVPNSSEDATHVDDLWHAAVNGRGQYWATSDPGSLSEAISTALSSVTAATGASSSAATSSLKPVSGENNLVFVATFKTVEWWGDLTAYNLNADTGSIDTDNAVWSAKSKLAAVSASSRRIYYGKPGTSALQAFTYANLNSDGLGTLFSNACTKSPVLSQCAGLDADPKAQANSGTNLVNFLRGDTSLISYAYGSPSQTVEVYRTREAILGDIVNASPVYMSKPPFKYVDTGYSEFAASKVNRKAVVFAAANDGMLHAFSAMGTDGGEELWAYVPRDVMPNLYQLADVDYKNKHRYSVDGTPVIADVYDPTARAWKTILVGGLNSGGKSYYALDVTDPENPTALWEFSNDNSPAVTGSDVNLGLTYGKPIVTKRSNGTWVVVFSSGYNNVDGDGNGRLYMLNAITGAQEITAIPTLTAAGQPVGSATTPSGLSKLNAWVEDDRDNKAIRFYGGDLLGNLWRFDTEGLVEPRNAALLLAKFQINSDTPQAITTRPELASIPYNAVNYPVVLVATGRYLGISDIADRTTQTIYAIKDPLTGTGLGDFRGRTDVVTQTLSSNASGTRTASSNTVNWSGKNGWRIDLPSSGERVAVDMQLQYTTLAAISAIPGTNECKPAGGSSWLYGLDISTGAALPSAANGAAGTYMGAYLGVGMTWIELPNGSSKLIIPRSDGKVDTATPPVKRSATASTGAHRTSWRELVN
ncbi:MAG: pilus assembly protein PilY [Rubrivivax sp.]|nr:MAG: pilus assembly protein PilY [Rubrivivax sp.]